MWPRPRRGPAEVDSVDATPRRFLIPALPLCALLAADCDEPDPTGPDWPVLQSGTLSAAPTRIIWTAGRSPTRRLHGPRQRLQRPTRSP